MRYFEISRFQVKQGHDKDWDEIVKLVTEAYKKIPDAHWVTYSAVYGFPDTTYIIFNPMKSAAEIDKNFAQNKDFEAAMGEEGMKKLAELSAAAIESSQTNLFAFNPRMSYPSDEWVKATRSSGSQKPPLLPRPPRNQRISRPIVIKIELGKLPGPPFRYRRAVFLSDMRPHRGQGTCPIVLIRQTQIMRWTLPSEAVILRSSPGRHNSLADSTEEPRMKSKRRSFPRSAQPFPRPIPANGDHTSVQSKCLACGQMVDTIIDQSLEPGETAISFPTHVEHISGKLARKPSNALGLEKLLQLSRQLYAHALTLQEMIRSGGKITYDVLRPRYDRQAAQQFEILYHTFERPPEKGRARVYSCR